MNESNQRTSFRVRAETCLRVGVVLVLLTVMTQISCQRVTEAKSIQSAITPREKPFTFESKRKPLIHITPVEKDEIWEFVRLPKDEELGLSTIVHLLKVYSERPEKYAEEICYLTSVIQKEEMAKKVLGDTLFRPSKFGIALVTGRTTRSQETHRDQGVAELGWFGTPTTFEIETNGKKYPFREAVKECVANFYLQNRELAWSATVMALYLPPQREWTNRYGERCNFDQLVDELMKRRFEDNSCAGVHLLETLTLIYKISVEEKILSLEKQEELGERLHVIFDALLRVQHESGYWRSDWFTSIPSYGQPFKGKRKWTPSDDPKSRILATCHVIEWFLELPDEFNIPDQTLMNAGRWMLEHLKAKDLGGFYRPCPYTHVVRDLELLSIVESDH